MYPIINIMPNLPILKHSLHNKLASQPTPNIHHNAQHIHPNIPPLAISLHHPTSQVLQHLLLAIIMLLLHRHVPHLLTNILFIEYGAQHQLTLFLYADADLGQQVGEMCRVQMLGAWAWLGGGWG